MIAEQPDLFEPFTRGGHSIVPPAPAELAMRRRDQGIERAAAHAESAVHLWQDRALRAVAVYARFHAEFMAEDARQAAERDGLAPPPDGRAWGAVMQRAAREGVIRAHGYAPANSSNRSPKVRWRSLVARSAPAEAAD